MRLVCIVIHSCHPLSGLWKPVSTLVPYCYGAIGNFRRIDTLTQMHVCQDAVFCNLLWLSAKTKIYIEIAAGNR